MAAMSWLNVYDRGSVRWLTMSRPDRKNAIPSDGWSDLRDAFEEFEESDARVLVIAGDGDDFCAGADLDPSHAAAGSSVVERTQRMKTVGAAAMALHRLTKPTIAAVDGVAVGAGMNLALGCDIVLASDRARFSEIFVQRGLTLDFGGSWLLPRVVGLQRAKELALSGRIVGAEEALAIGLCLEVVTADALGDRVTELAEGFASAAPIAQMFAKQGIDHAWDVSFAEALGWEGQNQAICFATDDVAEGIAAFLEKRPPKFRGR
jgi:2-(1,2-epoxy-1,2-dihydrophenyl)acetyl-CoA isomerase